jgi:serine/threonine protein phosphatase PrpC
MEISTAEWAVTGRRMRAAAGSIVGNRYPDNFDVLHLDPARPLAVVADGMGGGPGSTLAGRTAVDTFVRSVAEAADPGTLRAAAASVQQEVVAAGRTLADLTGCTLTAFVTEPSGAAWLVHLGDSRAYRLRDGLLELLTADHTMAWIGVLNGWYPPDSPQARTDRYRLTRYAGHPDLPEADLLGIALRPGDVLLLCTDGVSDQVGYERLSQLLSSAPDPAAAVRSVLAATLPAGDDNATAVVIN